MSEVAKQLKARREKLTAERMALEQSAADIAKKLRTLNNSITGLDKEIQAISNRKVTVTDHAMLRLLERGYGFPVEETRKSILEKIQSAAIMGATRVPVGSDLMAVIKDRTVVTIEPRVRKVKK